MQNKKLSPFLTWALALQIAIGPTMAYAEEPAPPADPTDEIQKQIEAQLNPTDVQKAIDEARAKIEKSRKTETDKRKERQGIAPTENLENENREPLRSHLGFLSDLVSQPRYRTPALIVSALEASAVLAYWIYVRKMKEFWIPRFRAMETLRTQLAEVTAGLETAETGFQRALVKNWATMASEQQSLFKGSLDPLMREKVLGELSQLEAGKLSTAEQELLKRAQSVDDAFRELTQATRNWTQAVRENVTSVESAINQGYLAEGNQGVAKAFNMRAVFSKELAAIEELETTLARPGLLSYYLRARTLNEVWVKRLSEFRSLAKSASVDSAVKARAARVNAAAQDFAKAEMHCRMSLIKNWNQLSYSQRSLYASTIDPVRQAEFLKELETKATGVGLTAKEAKALETAGNLDDSFKVLTESVEKLKRTISIEIPDAKLLAESGLNAPTQIVRAQRAFLNEATALEKIHKQLLAAQGTTASQASLRKTITSFEEVMDSMKAEAALNGRLAKAKFWSLRRWGPKLGLAVLVSVPVVLYGINRSNAIQDEQRYQLYLTRQMLNEDEGQLRELLNLPALRMQYGAFYTAWMNHPQLGGANIPCPLQPPGPPEALNPDLIHTFLNDMTIANVELNQERDADDQGVPEPIAKLSLDERLYRKVWTRIFTDAATSEAASPRIKLFRWAGKEAAGTERKPNEKARTVEDLIADLANTVAQMPQNVPALKKPEEEKPEPEAPTQPAGEQAPEDGQPVAPATEPELEPLPE